MTRGEVIEIIQQRLGSRSGLEERIRAELNLLQTIGLEKAQELPWFLTATDDTLVTVADSKTVAVPADFLRELAEGEGSLWLTDADGDIVLLKKDDFTYLHNSSWLDDSGQPTHCALVGTNFYLFPTPDAVFSLKLFYYASDDIVTVDGNTNLWLTHAADLIVAQVGSTLARHLRDYEAGKLFEQELGIAQRRLRDESMARAQAGMSVFMGG